MKNIQNIISNMCKNDEFKRLDSLLIINKIISTLPHNLRKSFIYASIKRESLFLAFNHPSSISEFNNYRKEIFKNALEQYFILHKDSKESSELKNIKIIQAFLPNKFLNDFNLISFKALNTPKYTHKDAIEYYKERAKGDFKLLENSPFYEMFKNIQTIIKNNNLENE